MYTTKCFWDLNGYDTLYMLKTIYLVYRPILKFDQFHHVCLIQ